MRGSQITNEYIRIKAILNIIWCASLLGQFTVSCNHACCIISIAHYLTSVHLHVCMHASCTHIYVHMYMCLYLCVFVCVCVCVCVFM